MQKRKRNPAPEPETIPPIAPPTPDTEPPATGQDHIFVKFLEAILRDLAINENRAGRIARRALRTKRDGTELSKTEDAEVRALLSAVGDGYDQASEANAFKPDGQGNEIFSFTLPPGLQDDEPETAAPPEPLPAPTAPPAPPQPQSAPRPYGSSGLLRVRRLLGGASRESRSFFEALMEEWDTSAYDLTETAFILSARALGYKHIAAEADAEKENLVYIDAAAQILLDGKWIANFLRRLFQIYRGNAAGLNFNTPEDAFFMFQQEIDDFENAREVAQGVLRDSPEVLAAELQELAQKRPDLLKPTASAAA